MSLGVFNFSKMASDDIGKYLSKFTIAFALNIFLTELDNLFSDISPLL